jgi:hypothetical protein
MTKTVIRLAAFGFVAFTTTLAPFAKADEWDKKTVITIHQPIQVQAKILEPGQNVMKLLNSSSDRHVLQIFNADETKLELTIFATPAYRVEPTADTRLTFSEMQDGQPPALRSWFYPGDNSGLEFSLAR